MTEDFFTQALLRKRTRFARTLRPEQSDACQWWSELSRSEHETHQLALQHPALQRAPTIQCSIFDFVVHPQFPPESSSAYGHFFLLLEQSRCLRPGVGPQVAHSAGGRGRACCHCSLQVPPSRVRKGTLWKVLLLTVSVVDCVLKSARARPTHQSPHN